MLKRLLVLGLLLTCATSAKAVIEFQLHEPPQNDAGAFKWIYDVVLSPGSYITPGDLATLYDFNGLLGPVTDANFKAADDLPPTSPPPTPRLFHVTQQFDGITPDNTNPLHDNLLFPNVTVSFLSGTDVVPSASGDNLTLGQLTLRSTFNDLGNKLEFTAQAHLQNTPPPNRDFNYGTVAGPVPEPSTITVMGVGLLAVAALGLRRRRQR